MVLINQPIIQSNPLNYTFKETLIGDLYICTVTSWEVIWLLNVLSTPLLNLFIWLHVILPLSLFLLIKKCRIDIGTLGFILMFRSLPFIRAPLLQWISGIIRLEGWSGLSWGGHNLVVFCIWTCHSKYLKVEISSINMYRDIQFEDLCSVIYDLSAGWKLFFMIVIGKKNHVQTFSKRAIQ